MKKHPIAFIIASLAIVFLIVAAVGLAYSVKNNSNKEIFNRSDSSDNSNSSVDEELQKIDTQIEDNHLDSPNNDSSVDTNLGV